MQTLHTVTWAHTLQEIRGRTRRHISRFHAGHCCAFILTAPDSKVTYREVLQQFNALRPEAKCHSFRSKKTSLSPILTDLFLCVNDGRCLHTELVKLLLAQWLHQRNRGGSGLAKARGYCWQPDITQFNSFVFHHNCNWVQVWKFPVGTFEFQRGIRHVAKSR